jgi:NADH dehydrogenase
VFGVPGNGQYGIQPVDVLDVARIATEVAAQSENLIVDAAGPETFTFREAVELVRAAVGSRALVVNMPATLALAAARTMGLFMHDVLLTRDEMDDLMAGLLVTHAPARGQSRFTDWLTASGAWLGRDYVPEVSWHYAAAAR